MDDLLNYRAKVGLFNGGHHFRRKKLTEWRDGTWEERLFVLIFFITFVGGLAGCYHATETLKVSGSERAIGYGSFCSSIHPHSSGSFLIHGGPEKCNSLISNNGTSLECRPIILTRRHWVEEWSRLRPKLPFLPGQQSTPERGRDPLAQGGSRQLAPPPSGRASSLLAQRHHLLKRLLEANDVEKNPGPPMEDDTRKEMTSAAPALSLIHI